MINKTDYRIEGARYFYDQSQHKKAREILKNELSDNPNNETALILMSHIHKRLKLFDEALEYINKALAINPRSETMLKKEILLEKKSKYDKRKLLLKKRRN